VLGRIPPRSRLLREAGESIAEEGPLRAVLRRLARRGITSVLVEGGARVHGEFLRAGLWDELRLFIAPKVFGEDALSWAGADGLKKLDGFELRDQERVGDDALLFVRPVSGAARGRGARRRRAR
jgi:diaminohydroxyphosphoribosylaminopyrimidine deaminase/5-amino-6-(5-phosphoribosylamino)uracil reductase